jgi:uncharacterized protein involved in exopolysaccharide biosynthesis
MTSPEAIAHHPEADSFQFSGALEAIGQAVRIHRWVVLATILLTTSLVGAYVWIWPPTFEAEVMVAIDSDKDIQRTAFYQGWNIFRKDGLNDEATLLTSPPVLKEVIGRLNLRYADVYHPFARYAVHLWGQSWVGRKYRQIKKWLLGSEQNPYSLSPEEIERYEVLSDLQEGVSVRQVGEASMGLLAVKASNLRVADLANMIVQVYLEQRRERYVAEARQSYQSLSEEAAKTQAELDAVGREIRKFRAETGTALLFEKDRGQINQWLALRGSITDLRAVIAENEAAIKVLDGQLAAEGENLRSDRLFKEDAQKERLPKLELALAAARQSYQPTAREVTDLEDQIREAQRLIGGNAGSVVVRNSAKVSDDYEVLRAKRNALQTTLQGAQAALQVRTREMASLEDLLGRIPHSMQVNHELERQQGYLENKSSGINAKLTVAAVSMATALSAPPAMRVVEPAHVPEQASAPKTKLLFAAAIVSGAVLGVIAALFLSLLHQRATRGRLQSQESPLRLLGVVGQDPKLLQSLFPVPTGIGRGASAPLANRS